MKRLLFRLAATLFELQTRRLLAHRRFKIVAVGGAVGKTTTTKAIATVLRQKYRVLAPAGGFNTQIGLPLAVFNLTLPDHLFNPFPWLWRLIQMELALHRPYPYDILVVEIGIDTPGEMAQYLRYIHPDLAVVTAIVPEHMEYFRDLNVVAREELALVAGSDQALVNYDDTGESYREQYVDPHPHHYYGLGRQLDYSFDISRTDLLTGTTGQLYRHGQAWLGSVTASLYGRHSARIIAAAAGAGDLLGLDDDQLRTGLSAIQPAPGRMARLTGAEDSIIVDDSYNSSPGAAKAALAALAEAPTTGRRLAIMGSMNELGDDAPRYHAEVGAIAGQPETRLDLLVTVGALANDHLGPAAVAAGLPSAEWHQFTSPREAGAWLRSQLKTGDVVLVKGSQNRVFTEEAAKLLLANPQDASKLVRQTRAWLRRKAKQFPATPEPLGD